MGEQSLETALALACQKVDQLLDRLDIIDKRDEAVEKRLSSLERWRAFLAGAWVVTSIVAGALWGKLH